MYDDPFSNGPEKHLRTTVLSLLWLELVFTSWLSFRQIHKIDSQTQVPTILEPFVYDIHDLNKGRDYSRAVLVYSMIKKLYLTLVWTIVVSYKLIYFGWNLSQITSSPFDFLPDFISLEFQRNIFFLCFCQLTKSLVMLPPTMYSMIRVEKKFGFYSSSWDNGLKSYLQDALLQTLVVPVFMIVVLYVFKGLDAMLTSRNWLLILLTVLIYWLVFPNAFVVMTLSGHKTFKHLRNGELKTRVEALAYRVSFPKSCIFVTSRFSGTSHSNAFHYGFLNFQRLVLFSTLIEGYHGVPPGMGLPPNLVEAVLAHELGHYALSHSLAAISFCQIKILMIVLASMWLRRQEVIYTAFGFPSGDKEVEVDPILPGLLITAELILGFPIFIINTVLEMIGQQIEYRADEFACKLGYNETLKKALVKVSVDNYTYPDADFLYALFCRTHPTVMQRIANINSFMVLEGPK